MTNDKNDQAIFLGMLADCPTALLIAELERRWGCTVAKVLPPRAALPFEVEFEPDWGDLDEGEALSA